MGTIPVAFREIPVSLHPVWIVDVRVDHLFRDFCSSGRPANLLYRFSHFNHSVYIDGGYFADLVLVQGIQRGVLGTVRR